VIGKKQLQKSIKNIVYVLLSQIVTLSISVITSLLLPKLLGVSAFGYWNIYLFYSSYIGIFHIGLVDGVYLRYGKYNYDELPKKNLRTTVVTLFIFQVMITAVILILLVLIEKDMNKLFSYSFAALNILIGVTGFFLIITQITNKFKLYSIIVIIGKILLLFFILFLYYADLLNSNSLIISDFIIKIIVLGICVYSCKDLVFGEYSTLIDGLKESRDNIFAGFPLMLANILGMSVIGTGRFIIDRFKSITDFSLYSFAISITMMMVSFISAVSLVIYPILSRLTMENLSKYYMKINSLIMSISFLFLLLYFPFVYIIEHYLENYKSVLEYLNILFPIIIFQAKLQFLTNNFFKILRKEKMLLVTNFSSFVMFILIGSIAFVMFKNIQSIVWSTLFVLGWRTYASEIYLKGYLEIKGYSSIIIEIFMIISFIIFTNVFGEIGIILFAVIAFIYLCKFNYRYLKNINVIFIKYIKHKS
jgi:O-antigen/teichoic acid export membrane protein